MRGKTAKNLRRAARLLVGEDAPDVQYFPYQQHESVPRAPELIKGECYPKKNARYTKTPACKPRVAMQPDGKTPLPVLEREEWRAPGGKGPHGRRTREVSIVPQAPLVLSHGVELRHDTTSVRGMYRSLKMNYLRVMRREGRAVRVLDKVRRRKQPC